MKTILCIALVAVCVASAYGQDTLIVKNPEFKGRIIICNTRFDSMIAVFNRFEKLRVLIEAYVIGYIDHAHPMIADNDDALIRAFFSKNGAIELADSVGSTGFTPWMPWRKASFIAASRFAERHGNSIAYWRGPDETRYTWRSDNTFMMFVVTIFSLLLMDAIRANNEGVVLLVGLFGFVFPGIFSFTTVLISSLPTVSFWNIFGASVVWVWVVVLVLFMLRRGILALCSGMLSMFKYFSGALRFLWLAVKQKLSL